MVLKRSIMDPDTISTIAGLPVNTVPVLAAFAAAAFISIRENKTATKIEKGDAEIALSHAYNLTHGYYASLNAGSGKSAEQEHVIADAWSEASIRLRKINANISNRLSLKSRFWREGAAWTDEQIAGARIGLEDVRREGTVVLRA